MKHIWSVLCRESVIDKETNNISIFNVFERLDVEVKVDKKKEEVKEFNVPIQYEVVSMWVREDVEKLEKVDLELVLLDPKGKTIKSFLNHFEIPPKLLRMRSRMKISGLPVRNSGVYQFVVKVKESGNYKEVARVPLEVRLKKENVDLKKDSKIVN